ncbi:MAG: response regulator [Acidobacteriota bacterium]
MTIREKLSLSLLVILALFAVNIAIYFWGNAKRDQSILELRASATRQLRLVDVGQKLDERRQEVAVFSSLMIDADDALLAPQQAAEVQERIAEARREVEELGRLMRPDQQDGFGAFAVVFHQLQESWSLFYERASQPPVAAAGEAAEPSAAPTDAEPNTEGETAEATTPDEDQDLPETLVQAGLYDQVTDRLEALILDEKEREDQATVNFFEVNRLTRRTTLLFFGLSALMALGVAFFSGGKLVRRLKKLQSGAGEIGRGNLSHRIQVRSRDELAQLAGSFNEMAANLTAARSTVEEARAAAERANRAKSRFLANMSHELRTPMNAIIGYSEMLLEDAEDLGQEETIPDLQRIVAASKHLLALINDILDLSKIEAGKMTLHLEDFAIGALLDDVVATVQPLIEKNSNHLEVRLAPELGTMRADQIKVRQILFNLLSNASKFTESGTVTLAAKEHPVGGGPGVRFEVRDTGIGMNQEQVTRVFEAFTQADSSTTREYGGTGLGLTISKRFCHLMGGEIAVDSQPGQGTAFVVDLPLTVEAADGAPVTQEAKPTKAVAADDEVATGSNGRGPVLVIDDDPATLDLVRRFLAREGFEVITAADGANGLELARSHRPAAITLDVLMPEMDGWTVLSELKGDDRTADIPVIMLSMMDNRELGLTLGAADYMTKPVDRDRLISLLRNFSQNGSEGRVLIVEDDAETRSLMRRMLDSIGWTVDEAANGRVGLERVAEAAPDLILLDLMMPEMDGFDFLEAIRNREERIPVVVVTAKDLTEEDRLRLNGYVEKVVHKGGTPSETFFEELGELVRACVRPADQD